MQDIPCLYIMTSEVMHEAILSEEHYINMDPIHASFAALEHWFSNFSWFHKLIPSALALIIPILA
jgi:hypothetical protein